MAEYELRQKVVYRKQPVIKEITELLDGAQSAVLATYVGIPVDLDTALRKELRQNNVTYKVYKNTMIRLAVQGTPFEALVGDLKGSTALAVSKEDATAPARVLAGFAKQAPMLKMRSGVVEGTYYDEAGITAVASIPNREVLLGRFLGSLKSPVSSFARVISQIAEKNGAPAAEAPAEAAAAE